eukprot:7387792-Prymnesium_polylepis.1
MRLNPQFYWKMIGPDGKPGGADHDIITGDAYRRTAQRRAHRAHHARLPVCTPRARPRREEAGAWISQREEPLQSRRVLACGVARGLRYGYVFAASEAGLKHILTDGVVVYPDDIGAGRVDEAHIIHYGLHCQVGPFHFTKYSHGNFNAMGCTGRVFGDPPQPTYLERLCAETVLTLNDAMCDFYDRPVALGGCGSTSHTCPAWEPAQAR